MATEVATVAAVSLSLGTSRPSPREREGSAFPLAWAHIKNRPTTTRPWKTTGHQGLPALPIGARVTPKILLTASRTSAKPDRTSAVLDSTQVARTFEATPHRGGSPQVRLASGGSHGHSDVMDATSSRMPTAATHAPSWLFCSNLSAWPFLAPTFCPSLCPLKRRAHLTLLQPRSHGALRLSPS